MLLFITKSIEVLKEYYCTVTVCGLSPIGSNVTNMKNDVLWPLSLLSSQMMTNHLIAIAPVFRMQTPSVMQ